ncbi:MAG: dethiobiotin synthase, partial [Mariprofundaceae bacterium]|nr:dethiobiotin synthase [Mariprofundaceae bacterium]
MPNNLFISATDTDAGKTFVSVGLMRAMLRKKLHAQVLKPMACGYEQGQLNTDLSTLLEAQNLPESAYAKINLYHFQAPLAPWLAGLAEG